MSSTASSSRPIISQVEVEYLNNDDANELYHTKKFYSNGVSETYVASINFNTTSLPTLPADDFKVIYNVYANGDLVLGSEQPGILKYIAEYLALFWNSRAYDIKVDFDNKDNSIVLHLDCKILKMFEIFNEETGFIADTTDKIEIDLFIFTPRLELKYSWTVRPLNNVLSYLYIDLEHKVPLIMSLYARNLLYKYVTSLKSWDQISGIIFESDLEDCDVGEDGLPDVLPDQPPSFTLIPIKLFKHANLYPVKKAQFPYDEKMAEKLRKWEKKKFKELQNISAKFLENQPNPLKEISIKYYQNESITNLSNHVKAFGDMEFKDYKPCLSVFCIDPEINGLKIRD
ncbi:hypothetical protein KGF54_004977 [Candida jiufengensis]|uniref:uncharacterized protein n=1 Tax=Candida jiufengensis TaxID=497108 RepID=UPI0022250740|nr:uncharacterized protein KGF54_004977 [Candida jiufengensis]KAI5951902.1 hypothetical protein KGF54_004977 [Candida jiufengensis]